MSIEPSIYQFVTFPKGPPLPEDLSILNIQAQNLDEAIILAGEDVTKSGHQARLVGRCGSEEFVKTLKLIQPRTYQTEVANLVAYLRSKGYTVTEPNKPDLPYGKDVQNQGVEPQHPQ